MMRFNFWTAQESKSRRRRRAISRVNVFFVVTVRVGGVGSLCLEGERMELLLRGVLGFPTIGREGGV